MCDRLPAVRSLLILTFVLGLSVTPWAWQAPSAQAAQAQAPAQVQAPAQAPAKDAVAGVRNFTKVDSTIACGGALSPDSFAALKEAGYKSIVNLRDASEAGANVAAEEKAAQEAGLHYIHLPFSHTSPDPAMIDAFLKAVVLPENQPMMLHCATGGRASMFWAVKRVMIDGWPVDKAMDELHGLSPHVGQPLRNFVLEYLKSHGKTRP